MKIIVEVDRKGVSQIKNGSGQPICSFPNLAQLNQWIEKNNHKIIKLVNVKYHGKPKSVAPKPAKKIKQPRPRSVNRILISKALLEILRKACPGVWD